jgi:tetratricopeptide (TPR) repeat protein
MPRRGLFPLVFALAATSAGAQQRFTTQVLLVPALAGPDRGPAGRASDIIRGRVASAFPRSELRVVSGGDLNDWLVKSGFEENVVLSEGELKDAAKKFRADERITGTISTSGGRVRLEIELAMIRDVRLSQPVSSEGANVNEAAEAAARDVIGARRQILGLRQCENLSRENKIPDALAAAAQGISAYPKAVPARLCMLGAMLKLDRPPFDSVAAVARAVIAVAPANAIALENLAESLDALGKSAEAAPVWVRLQKTDTASESLIERVVNALAREGNATLAMPIIDRGTDQHPENVQLLKLRWLVHLAGEDWKGATVAGERWLEHDAAARVDPEVYARLAGAYRADSQPARALGVAATAVSRFPKSAPLFVLYLQLLRAESDAALPRGLAEFPDNAELHVVAAQMARGSGNLATALAETKRAVAVNPSLPHGFLQLAQLELDAGQPDSALMAIDDAMHHGEDSTRVAQFALARGNAMYKAATASQKRDDFQRAMRFLALAVRIAPSAEAKFLLGASALSVSQSAATEAPAIKSCDLSKLADSSLTEAEVNLISGGSAAPDAAKQYLDYVAKLRPYVSDQVKSFCNADPRPKTPEKGTRRN